MNGVIKISLIIGTFLSISSCIKDDNFNMVPEIAFVSYEVFALDSEVDSAKFEFSFKDGDGDLGSDNPLDLNCFLVYQEKNGLDITVFPDLEDREYNLPNLTPNATDKNIEGTISLIIKPAPIFNITTDSAYRYSCYVVDRAGNKSNVIYGDWIAK